LSSVIEKESEESAIDQHFLYEPQEYLEEALDSVFQFIGSWPF